MLWSKNPWIPISISDSWLLEPSCAFLISQASPPQQQQRRQQHQSGFLILDHHLYRCFTKGDAETSVERHVEGLRDMNAYIPHVFARVGKRLEEAGCGFVIGEWSGALNPLSFKLSSSTSASASASASAGGEGQGQGGGQGEDEETLINAQRKKWVSAQMELYEKSCSGHFFWTYKKEETPGGGGGGGKDPGWSLRDAVEAGVYPSWVGLKASPHLLEDDDDNGNVKKERTARRDSARTKANGDHLAYWTKYEGEYEHWRFGEGFTRGWDDAYLFFTSSSSSSSLPSVSSLPFLTFPPIPELGFKGPWMKKRIEEHVKDKGDGKALWEFGEFCGLTVKESLMFQF